MASGWRRRSRTSTAHPTGRPATRVTHNEHAGKRAKKTILTPDRFPVTSSALSGIGRGVGAPVGLAIATLVGGLALNEDARWLP